MANLRTSLLGVVLFTVAGIGAVSGGQTSALSPNPGFSTLPVKTLCCGPNALYMLLKLQGRPVTFQQVAQKLGSDNKWTSMLELRQVAARLGLSTRIRRCPLEALEQCTTPYIAHTRSNYILQDHRRGHYLLVLEVDGERLRVVDGTTGFAFWTRRSKVSSIWTGYVLEPTALQQAWTEVFALNGFGLLVVVGVLLVASRRRPPTGAPKFAAGLLIFACWSAIGVTPVAASETPSGGLERQREWRTPANDAVNCLYLQLAILRHPVDYARVQDTVFASRGPVSMVALRDAAGRCGLPMKIVRCSPDELARLPKPVIVYMHDTRTGGGFQLLYRFDDEKCGLITGVATIEEAQVDKFRRYWSGFALIPEVPGDGWLSAVAGSLALIAAYSGWRLWLGK